MRFASIEVPTCYLTLCVCVYTIGFKRRVFPSTIKLKDNVSTVRMLI